MFDVAPDEDPEDLAINLFSFIFKLFPKQCTLMRLDIEICEALATNELLIQKALYNIFSREVHTMTLADIRMIGKFLQSKK